MEIVVLTDLYNRLFLNYNLRKTFVIVVKYQQKVNHKINIVYNFEN